MNQFKEGDIVYYDDVRLKILAGPFRTADYPNVDQYHVGGAGGYVGSAWASDLMSEDEELEGRVMTPYRILVTGSRDWEDRYTLYEALDMELIQCMYVARPVTLIHGDCNRGADLMANTWALNNGVAVIRHPAKWREHGVYNPQAGLARNRLMVELGADICLAFIRNGSRGASHCAALAEEAGIPVRRYLA